MAVVNDKTVIPKLANRRPRPTSYFLIPNGFYDRIAAGGFGFARCCINGFFHLLAGSEFLWAFPHNFAIAPKRRYLTLTNVDT